VRRQDFDPAEAARPGSLVRLMTQYLAALAQRNYSATTIRSRHNQLRQFAQWAAEREVRDAAHVTRPVIERYQRWLFRYRKEDGSALTVGYQTGLVVPVQMLFRWAVRAHHLPANPASDLEHPRPIRTLPMTLSPAQIEAILAVPDVSDPLGLRDRSIMETLYATGIRRMEVANLRLEDVDDHQGLLRVRQGKGHKDRVVPIGSRALHWHRRWLDHARPRFAPPDERAVYVNRRGRPLSSNALTPLVRRYVDGSGVRAPGSCHLFRHGMATALHNAGCDVRVIQELLGHARLDTTALYTRVGIAHLQAAHTAFHPAATLQTQPRDLESDSDAEA
jgi:integrase/recombinase XerD